MSGAGPPSELRQYGPAQVVQGPGLARKHVRDDRHRGAGAPARASLTSPVPASAPSQPGHMLSPITLVWVFLWFLFKLTKEHADCTE